MKSVSAGVLSASGTTVPRFEFFLGGHDLEMTTIRELVDELAPGTVHDAHLSWGATSAPYDATIQNVLLAGRTPVLVELAIAQRASWRDQALYATQLPADGTIPAGAVILADHHGDQAGAHNPTSLEQVLQLLGAPDRLLDRWIQLVAANDRGYVPEMVVIGASIDEMRRIRAADRAAQGTSADEDAEGEQAAHRARRVGTHLTIVEIPHDRTATVTDRLDATLGGEGFDDLLIVTPIAAHVFGAGETIDAVRNRFPGGWFGGALPHRGFWGRAGSGREVEDYLAERELVRIS